MADVATTALVEALRDRYVLERELGRGGMGTVWLAKDLRHERLVALKILRPKLSASLGPERFLREIRLTANLQRDGPDRNDAGPGAERQQGGSP